MNRTSRIPSPLAAAGPSHPPVRGFFPAGFAQAGVALALVAGLATAQEVKIDPMDWPHWRGPEQNGVSREVGLVDKWSPKGENLLWKREDLGTKSTPIALRGKLYFMSRHKRDTTYEQEKVVCLDAATGKTEWEYAFNAFNTTVPDTRLAWSSPIGDPLTGRIYALGGSGLFTCLEGDSGKIVWQRSMSEEFGYLTTYGGRTTLPVLFDDVVILNGVMIGWGEHARPFHRFMGLDKATGKVVWINAGKPLPDDTTYSTPTLGYFNGQALLVGGTGDGRVYAFQPRTGHIVWEYHLSRRGVNGTPLVVGDRIFLTNAEENPDDNTMGSVVSLLGTGEGNITKSPSMVRWRIKEWVGARSAPVMIQDKLFAVDDGGAATLFDPETGKVIFKQKLGTVMRSSALFADGKIYCCEANGRWYILKPSAKGFEIIHRERLTHPTDRSQPVENQASPIVSHGRIYLAHTDCLYCIGKKGQEPKLGSEVPPIGKEAAAGANTTPARLLVYPAELVARPGETIRFEARVYNPLGQLLDKPTAVEWTADGGARTESTGDVAIPGGPKHTVVTVNAKSGGLTGVARVRIIPDLPWSIDFNDGNIPLPWIGIRYRHIPRDVKGEKAIVKITTIPKGTRSQGWFGRADFHDYTIQADFMPSKNKGKMPDMGLIAQRYTLDMQGSQQKLQIRSWWSMLDKERSKEVPFTVKPDVWYTMKFQSSLEGGKQVLRGKVWERTEAEPAAWTIEYTAPNPNLNGSPGLFGEASLAEIAIDNLKVYPNASAAGGQ